MSQRRGGDGPRPPGDGDLPELPSDYVVPDDPRELYAEAETVRAELRAERSLGPRRGVPDQPAQRSNLSGPLIALVLMLVAAVGSLVIVVLPYAPARPVRAPLAAPAAGAGQVGGLLPDLRLPDERGRTVAVREVRPAVVLLIPAGCDCDRVAADLVRVTGDSGVAVHLVGVSPPRRPAGGARDRVHLLGDATGQFAAAVAVTDTPGQASGPTALLVRATGLISLVVHDLRDASKLRPDLGGLTVT